MAKKSFKKVLSFIMAFCMLVSLFTCVSLVPASATTSGNMFYIDCSDGGSKQVMFRHNSHSGEHPDWEFIPNTTYTFSARLKLESSITVDEFYWKLLRIYYYNTSDAKTAISKDSVTQSYDAETFTYSVTFTVPSDCRTYSNTEIRIGDSGWNGYVYKIWIADISLIAEGSTLDIMPAITEANSKVANSVAAENMYVRYNTKTSVQILSKEGTFPELTPETPEEPEPEPVVTSDLVEFYALANNCARMEYLKGWYTFPAGDYRFELDCKIFSGTPTIRIGMDGTFGTNHSSLLNYKATYDAQNCKYIITFTLAEKKGCNLNIDVGNYETDGLFGCANPELYLLDASGNATGSSLINTFASKYYTTSTVGSEKKDKWRTAGMSGNFTCTNPVPDGYFTPGSTEPETPEEPADSSDLIKITESGNWSCLKYTKSWSTIKAGNYRFTMDCKIFSGTPIIRVGNDEVGTLIDGYQSNYVATYDEENYKYIITFTMDSDWAGNLGVLVGNYGQTDLASFACANPTLYLLDANGNPTGNSLINTFSEENYSTQRASNKWNRKNMAAGLFTCTNPIPEGYFSKEYQDEENDYSLNPLDKAYVTFLFDDQRMPFTQEAFDLFQSHGVPLCCDVVAGRIEGNQEVIDLLLDIQAAGGEILSHTYTHSVITSANSTAENIEKEFGDSFRLLTHLGFNVNGIVETGDGGGEKTADYELMETIVRKYYKYSNAYGVSPQYKTLRTWLKDLGLDGAKALVDEAIEHKKWVILWAHDFSEFSKSDMDSLLSYISAKQESQVEVVTWNYVYENFANYTGPQVPNTEALESVCATYGHTLKDATVTKVATCIEKGEKTGLCSICSKQVTEEIEIDSDNHVNIKNDGKCDDCGATVIQYAAGDFNADGKTNVKDIVRLKKILAGMGETDGASADVNGDGETNSLDLNVLKKMILGLI